jgi:hypothetical protein
MKSVIPNKSGSKKTSLPQSFFEGGRENPFFSFVPTKRKTFFEPKSESIRVGMEGGIKRKNNSFQELIKQNQNSPDIQREPIPPTPSPAPTPTPSPTPTPTFSVNQATYQQTVSQALQNLSGRLTRGHTFTGTVHPILQSMFSQVVWRDTSGADHGGGTVTHTVPGPNSTVLNLKMVLDDAQNPPDNGFFSHSGQNGELVIRVRSNSAVPGLTEVLYHESLHMMSWIINNFGGRAAVPGVERRAVSGLDMSRFTRQIAQIRIELADIAQEVNRRRAQAGQNPITATQLDTTARWLMEEVQVRAETEVFNQLLMIEQQRGSGSIVTIPTRPYGDINVPTITNYIFEFSQVFTPQDQTGMTAAERQTIQTLTTVLEGLYQSHVRRRYSFRAFTTSGGRPQGLGYQQRPLQQPNFIPRIGEAVRHPPF